MLRLLGLGKMLGLDGGSGFIAGWVRDPSASWRGDPWVSAELREVRLASVEAGRDREGSRVFELLVLGVGIVSAEGRAPSIGMVPSALGLVSPPAKAVLWVPEL